MQEEWFVLGMDFVLVQWARKYEASLIQGVLGQVFKSELLVTSSV
jgi:hypothetical protein